MIRSKRAGLHPDKLTTTNAQVASIFEDESTIATRTHIESHPVADAETSLLSIKPHCFFSARLSARLLSSIWLSISLLVSP